jgi:uridine kinase
VEFPVFLRVTSCLPSPIPRPDLPIQYRDRYVASFRYKARPSSPAFEPFRPHSLKPLIIGIAGGTGSGKTTVARKIAKALSDSPIPDASVVFLDMDGYYRNFDHLTMEERRKINWDHPEAFDLDLFITHLQQLARGEAIEKPVYDFTTHLRSERSERITPAGVVVVDGILLFSDERVRNLLDVKIFVDADPDIRLVRRIQRDMSERNRPLEEILEQYLTTVRPMHQQFVEPGKRFADIIVPRGGENAVAIEMILTTILRRLDARRR